MPGKKRAANPATSGGGKQKKITAGFSHDITTDPLFEALTAAQELLSSELKDGVLLAVAC